MTSHNSPVRYPIQAFYTARYGLDHCGFAETAEQAHALYCYDMEPEERQKVPLPLLRETEGPYVQLRGRMMQACRTDGDAETMRLWSDEFQAGFAAIQDCGQWRKVVFSTWRFD